MAKGIWLSTLAACALFIGCAGADGNEDGELGGLDDGGEVSESVELGGLEQSLRRPVGGGTRTGYTCSGLKCTCRGDDDCNDMFEDGVCGDITSCDTSDPLNPVCECLIFKVKGAQGSFVVSGAAAAVFAQ